MARGGLVLLGLLCVLASAAAIQEVASFTARNGMAPLALKGRADARTPQPMRLRGGEDGDDDEEESAGHAGIILRQSVSPGCESGTSRADQHEKPKSGPYRAAIAYPLADLPVQLVYEVISLPEKAFSGLGCVVDVLGTAVGTATTFIVSPPVFMVIAAAGVYKAWEGTLFKGKGKKSVKKAAPAKAEKPAAASSAPKKGCLGLGCFGL